MINMSPRLDPLDGDCVAMNSDSMRVVPCWTRLPYMCLGNSRIETTSPRTENTSLRMENTTTDTENASPPIENTDATSENTTPKMIEADSNGEYVT